MLTKVGLQDKIEPNGKYDENWWLKAENHVGNGAFMWKTLKEKDVSEFVPNPNYYGGKPKLEMLTFRYITDSAISFARRMASRHSPNGPRRFRPSAPAAIAS